MQQTTERIRHLNLDRIAIPVENAEGVSLRCAPLPRAQEFRPEKWSSYAMVKAGDQFHLEIPKLQLPDGSYEYEFVIRRADGTQVAAADPYAEELTRFGGYRGIFHIRDGHRERLPFDWTDEQPSGREFPDLDELVVYQLPMRWIESPQGDGSRVELGSLEKVLFERLDYLEELGVNAIELLPIQDSSNTLTWGYGTRFFFAPDLDMGSPFDLKLLIKRCHQKGMLVIMTVVMNHSLGCPLEQIAPSRHYLSSGWDEPIPGEHGARPRPDWGGRIFRYAEPTDGGYPAREFQYEAARFWIEQYHVDGFRIDDFAAVNNWDFVTEFTARAHDVHRATFPERPFIVIAEDVVDRPQITRPADRPVVDACWDFTYRHRVRELVQGNRESLGPMQVRQIVSGTPIYAQPEQRVIFSTSQDVGAYLEQRLMTTFLRETERRGEPNHDLRALELVHSALALTLTSVGIPMILAGEEFADLDHTGATRKSADPVDWARLGADRHALLVQRARRLVRLRAAHKALARPEVVFFGMRDGFHPTFGESHAEQIFSYCRTAGRPLGSREQVVVVANCCQRHYSHFQLQWPWSQCTIEEYGGYAHQPLPNTQDGQANLELYPYQVRVFATR